MDSALQSFLSSVPQAVAIWLIILLVIAVAVAAVSVPRPVAAGAPGSGGDQIPTEEMRYAGELAAAADRAAAVAERRRGEWLTARDEVDETWEAYDEADRAARRAAAATAFPLMSRRRKPGDNLDRERYLHRAATELCRSHDLSIAQLNDVYAHRGWNPRLHPVVQEPVLRNAVRAHRFDLYRRAAERERAAWQEAETAAETLRELRAEAAAAQLRAGVADHSGERPWWAEQWTPAELPAAA